MIIIIFGGCFILLAIYGFYFTLIENISNARLLLENFSKLKHKGFLEEMIYYDPKNEKFSLNCCSIYFE